MKTIDEVRNLLIDKAMRARDKRVGMIEDNHNIVFEDNQEYIHTVRSQRDAENLLRDLDNILKTVQFRYGNE